MECEWENCSEKTVAFKPLLGMMRHLCAFHAGGCVEEKRDTLLKDTIAFVNRLEFLEYHPYLEGYDAALSDYQSCVVSQPITLARAIKFVLDREPARREPETDIVKPF